VIRVSTFAAFMLLAVPAAGSLYQPEEPISLAVKADGTPEPLDFDEFQSRMVTLANVANPKPNEKGEPNRDRAKFLDRVRLFQSRKNPTPDELAAHAADLLRLGNTDRGFHLDKAIDLLVPHTRDRVPNYFLLMTLAQVHLARGELREALNAYDNTLLDAKMPAAVKGWTEPQRAWFESLDNDYLGHYLQLRIADKEHPAPPDREEPTPLFPLPVKGKETPPLRFVNDAGEYEPGNLAAAERAKLPPNALAIVQQMLLWFPSDTRLYWLLAELYAAEGKLDEADTIFYQCTWGRQFGNRKLLMEHKGVLLAALEARRLQREKDQIDAYPINLKLVWWYFGGVVLLAALAVIRGRRKRAALDCPKC